MKKEKRAAKLVQLVHGLVLHGRDVQTAWQVSTRQRAAAVAQLVQQQSTKDKTSRAHARTVPLANLEVVLVEYRVEVVRQGSGPRLPTSRARTVQLVSTKELQERADARIALSVKYLLLEHRVVAHAQQATLRLLLVWQPVLVVLLAKFQG
jgi:hypothetical protein